MVAICSYVQARLPILVSALVLAACYGPNSQDPGPPGKEEDAVGRVAPLEDRDFAAPVTKTLLRETGPALSDAAFELKWSGAHANKLLFFRTWPGGYHKDMSQVAPSRIPGKEGLCFGDPHPDNFGFLQVGRSAEFLFNDLDDSGYCFVAVDAARYFSAVRLAFDNDDLTKLVLERYVDTLKDPSRAKALDHDRVPNIEREREDRLHDDVDNDEIVLDPFVITPMTAAEIAAIKAVAASDPAFAGYRVLDMVRYRRDEGGSGGLTRYWVLVAGVNPLVPSKTILELKEATTPAAERGRFTKTLPINQRLDVLKATLWHTSQMTDYSYVDLAVGSEPSRRFLVRDRLAKKSLDLTRLSPTELRDTLEAQASMLALQHARSLESVTKDDVRTWIEGTSKTVARRWSNAM